MDKIKKSIINICKRDDISFIVVAVLFGILHLFLPCIADDVVLRKQYKGLSLLVEKDLIIYDYLYWSSRVLINSCIHILLRMNQFIWALLQTVLIYVLLKVLSKLLVINDNNKRKNNFFIACIVMLYPYWQLGSAGWVTTSVTYMWALIFGLIGLLPIRKAINNEKYNKKEYVLFTICLILGANQEQMMPVLLAIYLFFLVTFFINKRVEKYIIFQTMICIASAIFILTAPGNNARASHEAIRYADFDTLSIIKKIELGFSSTMHDFMYNFNLNFIFCVFTAVILYVVWKEHKNIIYRLIGVFPATVLIFIYLIDKFNYTQLPKIRLIFQQMTGYGSINVDTHTIKKAYIPLFLMCIMVCAILVNLYLIFKNSFMSIFNQFIFMVGLGSRMALGFSPTIWASGERTYIFFYFAIIVCIINIYLKCINDKIISHKENKVFLTIFSILACANFGEIIYKIFC